MTRWGTITVEVAVEIGGGGCRRVVDGEVGGFGGVEGISDLPRCGYCLSSGVKEAGAASCLGIIWRGDGVADDWAGAGESVVVMGE